MDDDEFLYRVMNEEDPWYMGDSSDYEGEDEEQLQTEEPLTYESFDSHYTASFYSVIYVLIYIAIAVCLLAVPWLLFF